MEKSISKSNSGKFNIETTQKEFSFHSSKLSLIFNSKYLILIWINLSPTILKHISPIPFLQHSTHRVSTPTYLSYHSTTTRMSANQRSFNLSTFLWNARSFHNKSEEQKKDVFGKFDIVIITESWIQGNKASDRRGYTYINKSRTNKRGGGILIHF